MSRQRGSVRGRILETAMELFGEYGVNGTTLQMIADRLEVSKAAVYYHFRAKDDIVMAVAQPVLQDIARLFRIADTISDPEAQREVVASCLVELAVRHRNLSVIVDDPAMGRLVKSAMGLDSAFAKLATLLNGANPDTASRTATAMIIGGITSAVTDPGLQDVSDDDLHRALVDHAQHLLLIPRPLASVTVPR
ncbi:TetR/AcrR family transcriptional regulator [Mycobacterium frederiksbergense]|nr:TetR/AcrR family transcriptional regulator [Mycolicibacterium frederiksbergense]